MGHTPYGYRIEDGIAVIDQEAAGKLRRLYENYISGMSLKTAAAKAGIETYHGTDVYKRQGHRLGTGRDYPGRDH